MSGKSELSEAIEAFKRGDLDRALSLAQQAAAVSPTAALDHLVGLIHCRRGNLENGVVHLRLAAEAEPANPGFKVMLARALIDSGRSAEVLKMPELQPARSSTDLALWLARAEAAAATRHHEAAAEAWLTIATHRKIDPEAWTNLARSNFALKKVDEAEIACRKALALSPRNLTALLTLGLIYERTNRLDELDQLLDEALRDGIDRVQLSYLWAIREQRAGHLASARQLLLKSDPAQDPVRWYRLRAKIADKEGDAATAFDAMVRMNLATAKFDEWRERGAAFRQDLRALAAAMTPEWVSRIPRLTPRPGRPPIFLLGLPRSGTTLLDTFLMGHRSIEVIEEKEMLRRAGRIVEPITKLPDNLAMTLEQARQAYLDELGSYVDGKFHGVVIDKNPFNMLLAPLIDALFPGSAIIFAKRHPCDAVLSGFMQSYIPNVGMASFQDLSDAADMYDAAMSVWAASTELLPLNVHAVAYEDLIEDPAHQLHAVVDFLGLDWDERMMDHRTTAKSRGALTNTSYDQITEPLTADAVGRWRRYQRQLEPVLPVLMPWAKWLGYQD
jgi:Flp pilus assembly protein TadD